MAKYEPKSITVAPVTEVVRHVITLTPTQAYALYYAIDAVLSEAGVGVVGNRGKIPIGEPLYDLYDALYSAGAID